jgi:hypothetical protein
MEWAENWDNTSLSTYAYCYRGRWIFTGAWSQHLLVKDRPMRMALNCQRNWPREYGNKTNTLGCSYSATLHRVAFGRGSETETESVPSA